MDWKNPFRKGPKALDGPAPDAGSGEASPLGDAIVANEAVKKKQMLLLGAGGLAALIAGSSWIFAGEDKKSDASVKHQVEDVSVDEMVNKNMAEKEWRAQSEAQMMSMDNNMRALAARAQRADQLEAQLAQSQGQNAGMSPDTERVLSAYQNENEQLKAALAAARQSPVMGQPVVGPGATPVGPNALYGRTSPPSYQSAAATPAGQAAIAAAGLPGRGSEVSLVSFGEGASGTGSPVPKGNTVFTDSANYLPPNSIAVAKVIVGVDAAAGVQSQTDPLPVVLRITGPARSVYDNGRLLTTNIAGCLVNGAARGDLSSEKVYVKLQRMTCPQPNGRYAVSDVKGFIAFGGKTGVRGRVVSREGSLIGQAFLAGLAGGFGRGFSANTNSILSGTNVTVDGQRQQLSTGEILRGGLGEGVAQTGDMVSKYLIERAEQYQPVIEMPTGIDVEIVFLEGVYVRN